MREVEALPTEAELRHAAQELRHATQELRHATQEPHLHKMVPSCLRRMFEADGIMWRRSPRFATLLTPLVSMAYLIHHTANVRRWEWQAKQLPLLGLPLTAVAGFDREALGARERSCVLANSRSARALQAFLLRAHGSPSVAPPHDLSSQPPGYLSQSIKLYCAMYDMLRRADARPSLILEDDALVRYEVLPLLALALPSLHRNFSLLFVGSYSTNGHDSLPTGLHPRADAWHRVVMPAVGVVASARAARHVVSSLPIAASIDQSLSDLRIPSSPCRVRNSCFFLKPFAIAPGVYSGRGLFGGEGLRTQGVAPGPHTDVDNAGAAPQRKGRPGSSVATTTEAVSLANTTWCCEREGDRPRGAGSENLSRVAHPRCAVPCRRQRGHNHGSVELRASVQKAAARLLPPASDVHVAGALWGACLACNEDFAWYKTPSVGGGGTFGQ